MGFKHSEETKRKVRTEEYKRRLSEAGKGHPGFWKGKTHSQETGRKMYLANKGISKPWKGKPISEEPNYQRPFFNYLLQRIF